MKLIKNNLSEKLIINKYLKKLNFKNKGTFDFENDGAYLDLISKNYKLTVTTDNISEDIDFFSNDDPKSIAQKITTVNLSDIFAMGAVPHSYLLNLHLPNHITENWLNSFSNQLKKIQNKYGLYLLGGDLSKSNKLIVSSTFFGSIKKKLEIFQNKFNLYDDILITGNIGESKIGLEILKKKILSNINLKQYFKTKKILNNKNNIRLEDLINAGDDYELIIISNQKNRNKIFNIANKNNINVTLIGKIISEKGIHFDSHLDIKNIKKFDHFS